jgi:hypothetical protein
LFLLRNAERVRLISLTCVPSGAIQADQKLLYTVTPESDQQEDPEEDETIINRINWGEDIRIKQ